MTIEYNESTPKRSIAGIYNKYRVLHEPGEVQRDRRDTLDRLIQAVDSRSKQAIACVWPEVISTGLHEQTGAGDLIKRALRVWLDVQPIV